MFKTNSLDFEEIKAFGLEIIHGELLYDDTTNNHNSHIHDGYEIYINKTGDVSFMVEGRLYPISKGNVIVTRPYEHHNCIYNNQTTMHDHYCIFFTSSGNEFLDKVFSAKRTANNHIEIPERKFDKLFSLCDCLTENSSEIEKQFCLFNLLSLILGENTSAPNDLTPLPLKTAVSYINTHLSEKITVKMLSQIAHISVNTIENYFKQYTGMTPLIYIKNQRLSHAAKLLASGKSVTEAAFESGFEDCSYFIAIFKKSFGITPHKYKIKYNA